MDWLERVAEIRKICNVPAPARTETLHKGVGRNVNLQFTRTI
ncbi:hypothetical protein PN473_10835 [Dolichospermum circinale CS-545/17]|nr:hypothetical protein [Dolichospermum circinale CS-545/17]